MTSPTCTAELHVALKTDPALFHLKTVQIGIQPADAGAPALELSLCPLCYSTLSRELRPLGAGRRD